MGQVMAIQRIFHRVPRKNFDTEHLSNDGVLQQDRSCVAERGQDHVAQLVPIIHNALDNIDTAALLVKKADDRIQQSAALCAILLSGAAGVDGIHQG